MSENTVFSDGNDTNEISSLIGGFGFLNDGAFVQAKGYFDGWLEKDPNNASAHIGALLAELQLKNLDELGATLKSFENSAHFKEAYRLADEKLKQRLDTALHLKNAHQASYRAHTLLANPKRAKDYSEAAYYLAECLRYRKDDKDAVRQLKFCEEKYKVLTGNSLALQDDLRPDSDMLFASSRYVRQAPKPLEDPVVLSVRGKGKAAALENASAAKESRSSETMPLDNCIEYRPDIEVPKVEEPKPPVKEEPVKPPVSDKKTQRSVRAKKHPFAFVVVLILLAGAVGGIYYKANYDEICLDRAYSQYDKGNYEKALEYYEKSGLADPDFAEQCRYGLGTEAYDVGDYATAADYFADALNYSDGRARYDDARYQYIMANFNSSDNRTCNYLNQLIEEGYLNTAELYDELYAWKIEITCINGDTEDYSSNYAEINVNDPVVFHFKLTGGEPDGTCLIHTVSTKPSGNVSEYEFSEAWTSGMSGWFGWTENLGSTATGELFVEFFDTDMNPIGTASVQIVD